MPVAISSWRSALPSVCPECGGMRGLMGLLLMVQIGCFPFFWTTASLRWGWHRGAVVRVCAATCNPCNWECRISSDRKWMGRKRFGAEYTRRQWLIELFHALTDVILPKTQSFHLLLNQPDHWPFFFQTKHHIDRIWSLFVSMFLDSFGQLAKYGMFEGCYCCC